MFPSLDLFAVFMIASFLIAISPGAIILFVVQYTLTAGLSRLAPIVIAILVGDASAMAISLLGLGAILAASPALFTAVKFIGASYLIWVGLACINAVSDGDAAPKDEENAQMNAPLRTAFLLAALHPNAFIFYTAFFPQFIDPNGTVLFQTGVLALTFLAIASVSMVAWAVAANSFRIHLYTPAWTNASRRLAGSIMISVGVISALNAIRGLL